MQTPNTQARPEPFSIDRVFLKLKNGNGASSLPTKVEALQSLLKNLIDYDSN